MYVASFKLNGLGFADTIKKVTTLDRMANIGRCANLAKFGSFEAIWYIFGEAYIVASTPKGKI
jgi:hypothetical protein